MARLPPLSLLSYLSITLATLLLLSPGTNATHSSNWAVTMSHHIYAVLSDLARPELTLFESGARIDVTLLV